MNTISAFLKESSRKIKPDLFLRENEPFLRDLRTCLVPKSALQDQTEKDQKAYLKIQESVNYLLNQVEKKAIMPTPALTQIGMLLLTLPNPPPARKGKPCDPNKKPKGGITIDAEGNEIVETKEERQTSNRRYDILVFLGEFDAKTDPKSRPKVTHMWQDQEQYKEKTFQEAQRKCYRVLFKMENSVEARIVCSDGVSTTITREEAIAELMGKPRSPICKPQVKSAKQGWGVRSKAYKIHFSGG